LPKQRVIIEISPSRVEVGLLKGSVVERSGFERFNRADWPAPPNQAQAIAETREPLLKLVADLCVAKASATVIYTAAGSVANLTSCPAAVSPGAAEQAARLALTSIADFPLDDAPVDSCLLLAEKPGPKAKPAQAEAPPEPAPSASSSNSTPAPAPAPGQPAAQKHVLLVADAENRVAALVAMVEAAGLCVDALIPADAVAMARAVDAATAPRESSDILAALWMGEHASMLAVGLPGRLLFARPISGGTESLADALTRPLRPRDPEAQTVNLKHDQARTLLLACGVPAPDAEVIGHPTLAGSALLPHLQPLLQRLSVELKQSIRFGVAEPDRPRVRLALLGPGAAVPALAAAIARLAALQAAPAGDAPEPDALESSSGGLIAALLAAPHLSVALMSQSVRESATRRTLRKALLVGGIVGAAFVGLQFADARAALSKAQTTLADLRARSQAQEGPAAVRQMTFAARQAVAAAEGRVIRLLGSGADAAAVYAELARLTPDSVRLLSADLSREPAPAPIRLAVRGYVRLDAAVEPAQAIKSYVDALAASPLVESVRLGATQRTTMRGYDSQSFDLAVTIVPVPPLALLPELAPKPPSAEPHAAARPEEARP
jgi:hypothetical protein